MAFNAFNLLEGVPVFDGKPEELEIFILNVEEIRKFFEASLITLFDLRVRNKIVSKANIALINNNNPIKWEEIKVILRVNFNISDSVESIVNSIKTAEIKTDISDFYDYMLRLLTKLNLKTSIDKRNEQWYSCKNNESMVLKIFISKLPNEPKLVLNSRNPDSLLKAKEILVETEYFYPKKSKSQSLSLNSENNNNGKYFRNNRNKSFTNSQSYSQSSNPNNNFNQDNARFVPSGQNNYGQNNNSNQFGQTNFRSFQGNQNNFPTSSQRDQNNSGNFNKIAGNINNNNNVNRNNQGHFNLPNNAQYRQNSSGIFQNPNYSGNPSYSGNTKNNTGNFNAGNSHQSKNRVYEAVPMDVDNIQISDFQSSTDELYHA